MYNLALNVITSYGVLPTILEAKSKTIAPAAKFPSLLLHINVILALTGLVIRDLNVIGNSVFDLALILTGSSSHEKSEWPSFKTK